MSIRFGTDGLRGRANTDLTGEVAIALGRAAATVLPGDEWFIGWDTRDSSPMLAAAFSAGVASTGRRIVQLGGTPTAGVAYVCRGHGKPGAVVTASHNPFHDNGIKIFGSGGDKLTDDVETAIEAVLHGILDGSWHGTPPERTGDVERLPPASILAEHRDWLTGRAAAVGGAALRIAVDCANGAAYDIAPGVIAATGASVEAIGVEPDGTNINKGCGSTDLDRLKSTVTGHGLDFGLAFDGDADRLLAVDRHGEVVDGDEIIAVLARHRHQLGTLTGNGIVVTEWSNTGLLRGMRGAGISVEVCEVGDRFVAESMRKTGYVLGGEQSGHIIISDLLQVGDGISTAIELMSSVVDSGQTLDELAASVMHKVPQISRTVRVAQPRAVVGTVTTEWRAINAELGDRGRLVLRPSGTENLVRVMAEAPERAEVEEIVRHAVEMVTAASGAQIA